MPRVPIPPETAEHSPHCTACGQSAMFYGVLRSGYSSSERLCDDCFQMMYTECPLCECLVSRSDLTEHPDSGEECCPDCAELSNCECCGDSHDRDDLIRTPDGESYCPDCYSDTYEACECCGDVCLREYVHYIESADATYCSTCYSDNYFYCEGCCEDRPQDEYRFDGLCEGCCEEQRGPLHNYSYRPDPIWHGTDGRIRGTRYLGIEIETESHRGEVTYAEHVTGSESVWYAKEDGSLSEYGVEFVSHPGTIDYWRSHNWKPFSDLRGWGYRSYNADTSCGIHVHVSRDSFTDWGLAKLALFANNADRLMVRASRRRRRDLEHWANVERTDNKRAIHKAKYRDNRRYEGLNFQNSKTVEFRIFRGTLHTGAIVRYLDFVIAVCAYAERASYGAVTAYNADARFLAWLRTDDAGRLIGHKQCRNLLEWLA